MAIRREAPNGVIVKFPDGTSEETIAEYRRSSYRRR